VGVIGWPVAHSLSPVIHNAAFVVLHMDWVYVPLPVPAGDLSSALGGLRGLGFAGANVTMPHKTEAADLADRLSNEATRLRAVNTLVVEAAGLIGHNTDVQGFARFLERDAGFDPGGRRAVIFGAGGAARACALALARAGAARIAVAVRRRARGAGLRAMLEEDAVAVELVEFQRASTLEADLVVNATPLGAHGEELPLPVVGESGLVVDLLYRPTITPLQARAREAGAMAFGGLGLLLHQAALSFELWTGREPPLDVMSAAALAELA
jgi:shikimate dehydrogenase